MPITQFEGGTVITGHAIQIARYKTFIIGLRFEVNPYGLRMTRGPSVLARAKRITGLKTNDRAKHIAWFEREIDTLAILDAEAQS